MRIVSEVPSRLAKLQVTLPAAPPFLAHQVKFLHSVPADDVDLVLGGCVVELGYVRELLGQVFP
jgi:hypothetical protein